MHPIIRRFLSLGFGFAVGASLAWQFHVVGWIGLILYGVLTGLVMWVAVDPLPVFRAMPIAARQAKYHVARVSPSILAALLRAARRSGPVTLSIVRGLFIAVRWIIVRALYFLLPMASAFSWIAAGHLGSQLTRRQPLTLWPLVNDTISFVMKDPLMNSIGLALLGVVVLWLTHAVRVVAEEYRRERVDTHYRFWCVKSLIYNNPIGFSYLTLKALWAFICWLPKAAYWTGMAIGLALMFLVVLLYRSYRMTHSQLRLTAMTDGVLGFVLGTLFYRQPLSGLLVGLGYCLIDHYIVRRLMPKTEPFAHLLARN